MTMKYSRLVVCYLITVIISACSQKKEIFSDNLKIIALSPSIVETIFFLGKGDNIIGTSSFCNYPEKAKNILVVANISDINLELTLRLKPDMVFLMPSQKNIADKLALLNIKSATISQESLNDILNSFLTIGKKINSEKKARFIYDSLRTVLDSYNKPSNNKKVLISVGREYGTEVSYIYSNGETGFLYDIILLLGYSNALQTKIPYPKIGAETIMSLDPDIIIDLVSSNIDTEEKDLINDWKFFSNSKAWKNNRIFIFKGDYTTIPGPRIFDFIRDLNEKGSD
ncbi:MAG: ABC transporter substrate-binding protein [Candidatus Delongbacteria bacterium]|nr:ABC transporter substrate-binding protein [Candidatus Delongbacteria bacterium]MCG2761172.1 ABC transporter substrate-binding protein [Candidatus Delongbacteria bacterium]